MNKIQPQRKINNPANKPDRPNDRENPAAQKKPQDNVKEKSRWSSEGGRS